MEWLVRLQELEDISVGVYVKARAEVEKKGKTAFKDGNLVVTLNANSVDEVFLKELEKAKLITYEIKAGTAVMCLGTDYRYFTEPDPQGKQADLLNYYCGLCREFKISANESVTMEGKTFSMLKVIRGYSNHLEIMRFAFENWHWLKKELNVGLPTINVLASNYYWNRIANQYKNRPVSTSLGNRYEHEETEFSDYVPPR